MINDKVKALAEINPQEPLIFTFFATPFFLFVSFFFSILYIYSRINLRYSFEMPSRCVRDAFEIFFYKQLKFRKRIILLEILKRRKCV